MSDFEFGAPAVTRKSAKGKAKQAPPPSFDAEDDLNLSSSGTDLSETADTPSDHPASKYDSDELAAIFDEILFSGEYSEDVTIKNKLHVTFRNRTADEVKEINRIVDGTTAVFASTLEQTRSILHLQYALTFYQGKDLRSAKVEDRAKFIGRLPGPIIATLLAALAKFDEKVFAACAEAEENF